MTDTNLLSLHVELLRRVCEHLDYSDPSGLLAFAQVNKHCYAVASSLLVRTIKVAFMTGSHLTEFVNTWDKRLSRDGGYPHVRRLLITHSTDDDNQRLCRYMDLAPCERYEDASGLSSPWDLLDVSHYDEIDYESLGDTQLQSLASLVQRCTGLRDLFFACHSQFPPSLLQILHDNMPRCRLHHYMSHRRDTLHVSLATSPSLYSIGEVHFMGPKHHENWHLVRHRASQLREAYISFKDNETLDELTEQSSRLPGTGRHTTVPLEVLHFDTRNLRAPVSFSMISWAVHGDFSALRVLTIDHGLKELNSLPPASHFPVLATFAYRCSRRIERDAHWDTLVRFLHDLPCLTTLQLWRWKRSVGLVPALNPNLRKLNLSFENSPSLPLPQDHVHYLSKLCPHLEDLTLELTRSRGDAAEVALYRALGHLPRLQHLEVKLRASRPRADSTALFLDADGFVSQGTTIEPWFDAEDAKLLESPFSPHRHGHYRDLMVNRAVDSDLARSIFQIVDNAKAGVAGSTLPLQRLEISTLRVTYPGRGSTAFNILRPFLDVLDRTWVVDRVGHEYDNSSLRVTEIASPSTKKDGPTLPRGAGFQRLLDIWQRLWPPQTADDAWWTTWKSLPLAIDAEEVART